MLETRTLCKYWFDRTPVKLEPEGWFFCSCYLNVSGLSYFHAVKSSLQKDCRIVCVFSFWIQRSLCMVCAGGENARRALNSRHVASVLNPSKSVSVGRFFRAVSVHDGFSFPCGDVSTQKSIETTSFVLH